MTDDAMLAFVRRVADIFYDCRPCSHTDGCHDHDSCAECMNGPDPCRGCSRGFCCDPADIGTDEEHETLVMLAIEAQELLRTAQ